MGVLVVCDRCGKRGHVNDEYAGRQLKCLQCGSRQLAPVESQPRNVASSGGMVSQVYFNFEYLSDSHENTAWERIPGPVRDKMLPVAQSDIAIGVCKSQGFSAPPPHTKRHLAMFQSGEIVAFYFMRGNFDDVKQVFKAVASAEGKLITASSSLFDEDRERSAKMLAKYFGVDESVLLVSGKSHAIPDRDDEEPKSAINKNIPLGVAGLILVCMRPLHFALLFTKDIGTPLWFVGVLGILCSHVGLIVSISGMARNSGRVAGMIGILAWVLFTIMFLGIR